MTQEPQAQPARRVLGHTVTLFGVAALALVAACGRPDSMKVRSANDPHLVDEDVAFRATYYFRVFDYCVAVERLNKVSQNLDEPQWTVVALPLNDTLYRFRLTGKANTLFNNIHFEAGTLRAAEIDPFGADVVYDKNTNRFRFQSQEETAEEARRERALEDYRRLLAEYRTLNVADAQVKTEIQTALKNLIVQALTDFSGNRLTPDPTATGGAVQRQIVLTLATGQTVTVQVDLGPLTVRAEATDADGKAIKVNQERPTQHQLFQLLPQRVLDCNNNGVTRRGFQVLGPEGWRTFDQDERLLMAMSSDAEPLIGTLKDLSGRVLRARSGAQASQGPIQAERILILQAERALDNAGEQQPRDLLADLRAAFEIETPATRGGEDKRNEGGEKATGGGSGGEG